MLSAQDRKLRAQIAANARWAKEARDVASDRARRVLLRRFEDEVDPDRVLSETERQKRANNALQAHVQRMAYNSARARRQAS